MSGRAALRELRRRTRWPGLVAVEAAPDGDPIPRGRLGAGFPDHSRHGQEGLCGRAWPPVVDIVEEAWHPRKVPGNGSAAVGTGGEVGGALDTLPQLAAEAEGSSGTKGRKGTGGSVWGGPSPCEGPAAIGFQTFRF